MSDKISEQDKFFAYIEEDIERVTDRLAAERAGRDRDMLHARYLGNLDGYEYDGEIWEIVSVIPASPGYENHFKRVDDGKICKEPVPAWLIVENRQDRLIKKSGKHSRFRNVPAESPSREVVAATLNESRGLEIARDIKNYEGTFPAGYKPLPDAADRVNDDIYGREW